MAVILVVDDMSTVRELIGKLVVTAGHTPVFANDGDEVLDKARQHRPALILMDVVMPKEDGFKVCRTLKATDDLKHIPVVLVSSKNSDSDKFWGTKQGANEMLPKPFSDDLMLQVIKRFVH